jgi:CRISPR-associated protein Cmr5
VQTRDQILATRVYELVRQQEAAAQAGSKARTAYGSMAHKLPVLIRTAGLAQAVAFVETRGDDGQRALLAHLEQALQLGKGQLAARSRGAELGEYVLLTRRSLDALLWFKRFAQSVLGVEASAEVEDSHGR